MAPPSSVLKNKPSKKQAAMNALLKRRLTFNGLHSVISQDRTLCNEAKDMNLSS
jgi:hypothetical protein